MTKGIGRRWLIALSLALGLATSGQAQTGSSQAVRPIGVVTAIDAAAKRITLKTDAGSALVVLLRDDTSFVRVPPGAKDLKEARKIAFADIGVGDRVLVRGKVADDQKSIPATSVVVMTQADIAKKHEADRAEWQKRGVSGTITALEVATKQITISTRTPEGRKPLTVALGSHAEMRRYAPDSVKFSDAKPSTFDALKVGDEVRALGEKSEDGSRYTAEEVVSGSFRNIAGTVITISTAENIIKITDLETKKPLSVRIDGDSQLRKLPEMVAEFMAMRLRGGGNGMGSGGNGSRIGPGGNGPGAGVVPARASGGGGTPGGPSTGGPRNGPGGGGGSGGGMMRGSGAASDISQMLERMPVVSLSDLRPGDAIIVASTVGADPSQVTAITLLTGVEPLLRAAPDGAQQMNLGNWNLDMNMNMQ